MSQQVQVDGLGPVEFPDDASPEEIQQALNQQFPPPNRETPQQPVQTSAAGAFGRSALQGVGPGAAFVGGFETVAPAATALSVETGPFAPAIGAVSGLVAGGVAAWAAHKAQNALLKAAAPDSAKMLDQYNAADQQQHPAATFLGDLASMSPSAKLAPFKLATLPFRAGLGAGMGAVQPMLSEQRLPTSRELLEGAAMGTVFGEGRIPSLLPKATQAAFNARILSAKALRMTQGMEQGAETAPEVSNAQGDPAQEPGTPLKPGTEAWFKSKPGDELTAWGYHATYSPSGELLLALDQRGNVAYKRPARLAADDKATLEEQTKDMGVQTEMVLDPTDPAGKGEPYAQRKAGQFMGINREKGTIEIYPQEFAEWLETVPKDQRAEAIRSRLAEEQNHLQVDHEQAKTYWDTLTGVEKQIETWLYTGSRKGRADVSDTDLGFEAIRRRIQRLQSMDSSEVAEAATSERWKLQSMEAINDTIRGVREKLGTNASKEGLALLDKIQGNADVATAAIGGAPAALRRGEVTDNPAEVNGKTWYHGTGTEGLQASDMDPFYGSHESLMGHGVYLTDNQRISEGYARARSKNTGTPAVYQARVNVGKVLDLGKPADSPVRNIFQSLADQADSNYHGAGEMQEALSPVMSDPQATTEHIMKAFRNGISELSHGAMVPTSEFVDTFQELSTKLRQLGYDALTHQGGVRTGNEPHQALIMLDPHDAYSQTGRSGQITEFSPVTSSEPSALRRGQAPDQEGFGFGGLEGKLSAPETAPAVQALREAEQASLAKVSHQALTQEAQRHISESARPSFGEFATEMQDKLGKVQPGQLNEAWRQGMWNHLENADGAELGRLRDRLGLGRELGKRAIADEQQLPPVTPRQVTESGPVIPPTIEEVINRKLTPPRTPEIAREKANYRAEVQSRIGEKLLGETDPKGKAWTRADITPEDVGHWRDSQEGSYRAISPDDASDPARLGQVLTENAAVERGTLTRKLDSNGQMIEVKRKAPPESVTKRVTVMQDKATGRVEMVSTYRTGDGVVRAVDPAKVGKVSKPNVELSKLLDRYRPMYSVLLDEPVQNFRKSFPNYRAYEQEFGTQVRADAQQQASYEASSRERETGVEPIVEPPRTTQPLTNAEARHLLRHLKSEVGKVEGPADVRSAITALADKPEWPVISAYEKISSALDREHGGKLSDEELLNKVAEEIHEHHQSNAQDPEAFAQALLERYLPKDERALPNREEDAGSGFDKELTMPIERRPPTDIRPENVPPGSMLPKKRPPEMTTASNERLTSAEPAALNRHLAGAKDELEAIGHQVAGMVTRSNLAQDIGAVLDSASNWGNNFSRQRENHIRGATVTKGTRFKPGDKGNKQVLSASNALVESGFNRTQLPEFLRQIEAGRVKAEAMANSTNWADRRVGRGWLRAAGELKSEVEYAMAHWSDPELQDTAQRVKQELADQYDREKAAGYDIRKDANYLPHRYDAESWNSGSVLFREMRVLGKRFRQAKSFPTHYDAIAEGPYIPVTRDSASLVGHRVRQGMTQILGKEWHNSLKSIILPDGDPLAMEPIRGTHDVWNSPDRNYEIVELGGGQKPLAVHSDFAGFMRNLVAASPIESWAFSRNLMHFTQMLKHSILLGDFFHLARMTYYGASLVGPKAVFNRSWRGAWSVLDLAPGDVAEWVRKGVVRPEDAAWATAPVPGTSMNRRQLSELFQRNMGLNVGRIQDALYKDLITDLTPTAGPIRRTIAKAADPSIGAYNRFLFDKLTRGLMLESAVRQFETQWGKLQGSGANPNLVMRDIAKDVNNFFGNINRQGWFKAKWQQDLARMMFLAPQWVEGLAKKEAVTYSRLSGLSSLTGQRKGLTALGTTGTAIGKAMLFMSGLTQAINLITRGHPTWMNDEKDHKADAWIPAWNGSKEGFWMSPLSVFNELTHDFYRIIQAKPKVIDAFDQIVGNKESPLVRAGLVMLTGRGPTGEYQTTTGGQLATSLQQVAPVPITFGRWGQLAGHAIAPNLVRPPAPGSLQRQTAGTFGVKIEPAASDGAKVADLARQFMTENKLTKTTGWMEVQTDEPGYTKLRQALRADDQEKAKKMLDSLRESRTDSAINKAMKTWSRRGFTGSAKTENLFIHSLDDKGGDLYFKAMDQKQELYQKYLDWVSSLKD